MTTGGCDDPAYPYSPRGAAALAEAPCSQNPFPWRTFWRWTRRIASVFALAALPFLIAVGIIYYRAARQAWRIAELERLGATVQYHPRTAGTQYSAFDDRSSDRWWGEVREISHENLFQSRKFT